MPGHHSNHDRFAVAGQSLSQRRLAPVTVEHVPRELSRYIWHAIERGAICDATVLDPTLQPSPLLQGRLEVLLELRVKSNDVQNL